MDRIAACYNMLERPVITEIINPNHWGPSCWHFLHSVSLSYPLTPTEDEKKHMYNFFHALKHVLPCVTCKVDFAQMLEDDPIERHLQSRQALSRWLVDKHNAVNLKTGKPILSYEDAVALQCNKIATTTSDTAATAATTIVGDGGAIVTLPVAFPTTIPYMGQGGHVKRLVETQPSSQRNSWVLLVVILTVVGALIIFGIKNRQR